ncbi:hypothetical protein [Desmospora activa]|uniref:Uncharacterized protein n=1 Tax=Desmospora activa DSM 45169 TaxID=1121389 RepID=A0A2T4Z9T9_9BACL|nr:hypothetical protein [Desmospora activa]PTM58650.1 hypothetical protein C8J48_1235 [Desmospora activa DSM 45169]
MHGWLIVGWIWLLAWVAVARFPPEPEAGVAGWWRWVSLDYALCSASLIWASWLLASRVRRWLGWVLDVPLPLVDRRRFGPGLMIFTAVGAGVFLFTFLPGHTLFILGLFMLREWLRWLRSHRLLVESGWGKKMR